MYPLPTDYNKLTQFERKKVREQYILQQGGACFFCEAMLNEPPRFGVAVLKIDPSLFPSGFFKNPVHLHHNHKTGMTIGAVHAHCNAVLWQYHDE